MRNNLTNKNKTVNHIFDVKNNATTSSTRSALGIFFTTSGEKVLYLNQKDNSLEKYWINTLQF